MLLGLLLRSLLSSVTIQQDIIQNLIQKSEILTAGSSHDIDFGIAIFTR